MTLDDTVNMLKCLYIIVVILVTNAVARSVFPVPRLSTACTQVAVRRDITKMSPGELERFFEAAREMHRRGWLDGFGSMHDHISRQIHGNENFFGWHRRFIRHFEMLMQQIDPGIVLPYWNWGARWQNPLADPVLGKDFFGGTGRPGDNCVMDGVEGRWGRNYPSRGCLVRKFRYGTTPGSFWPMRAVRDVMASSQSHAEFRSRIENGAHGIIHLGLGGDFETMWAPVDVLFFLHHAMVDKIWAEWQSKNPSRLRRVDGFDSSHQPLTVNSPLPFYGDTIGTTLVTTAPGYCYMYDDVAPPPDNARSRAVEFRASVRNSLEFSNDTDPDNELFAAHEDAEDLEPPEPAPENWLSKRGLDVEEAARMHVLVSRVVRQMNEERRAFIRALNGTKAASTDQNQPL